MNGVLHKPLMGNSNIYIIWNSPKIVTSDGSMQLSNSIALTHRPLLRGSSPISTASFKHTACSFCFLGHVSDYTCIVSVWPPLMSRSKLQRCATSASVPRFYHPFICPAAFITFFWLFQNYFSLSIPNSYLEIDFNKTLCCHHCPAVADVWVSRRLLSLWGGAT